MSRRSQAQGQDRSEQNRQALKALVKLETNKSCADCKKAKHPRWASWNIGIFVCIRCSGIHRGMGTHISRVKSVDLDSWTDEQTQSMLRWGNARANKYWEAKLAHGHVPAEAKIENFIRTKYDSKRWVMDGPMPDPATLDGDDDEVPLSVVQEQAKVVRSASQRAAATTSPTVRKPLAVDLFGDDPSPMSSISRPNTTEPVASRPLPPPKTDPPPRATKTGDSLLGFDFFGITQPAPPARPSSTSPPPSSGGTSRPDLKQSILSLYGSAPKPAVQNQRQSSGTSFSTQPSSSGLDDAFGGLNFGGGAAQNASAPQPKSSPFNNLASPALSNNFAPPSLTSPLPKSAASGGSFFDSKSKPTPKPSQPSMSPPQNTPIRRRKSSGFGDFESFQSPVNATAPPPPSAKNNNSDDLFGLMSSPTEAAKSPLPSIKPPRPVDSPFNLSNPGTIKPPQALSPQTTKPTGSTNNGKTMMNMDPWGSDDVWASSNKAVLPNPPLKSMPTTSTSTDEFTWGDGGAVGSPTGPKVTQDEDFGGWDDPAPSMVQSKPAPAPAPAPAPTNPPKPAGGFGAGEDLFSNVWE